MLDLPRPAFRAAEIPDLHLAGMDVFGHRPDAEQLVRSLVICPLFPTTKPMQPFVVLIEQNVTAYDPDQYMKLDHAPFFKTVAELPILSVRKGHALFSEILLRAHPADIEAFWDECKLAAAALGQMFAPAARAETPERPLLANHFREELKESEGRVERRVLLVGGWPKRAMVSPLCLEMWRRGPGFPILTRDGDRLAIEITDTQAVYRVVREIDSLLQLELIGAS
jgi:hypothetical protein